VTSSAQGYDKEDFMRLIILVAALVVSLVLNVATIAVGSVASAVSSVFEAVTGLASVAGDLDRSLKVERAKVSGKEQQLKVRDRRLAAETAQVKKLKEQVAGLKPKDVTHGGRKKLLSEAVEETTQRVTKRTTAGATRNVAATFGEAIPVIGVGVVVAATAWELKDACDTMKDLHELEVALDPTKASDASVQEVCGMKVPSKEEIWEKVKASPGEAWANAKAAMPDLPEMPSVDWKFWD
jgi:hypothetical protein